jgi:diguanylate cyclase (GGDEF)-like protein
MTERLLNRQVMRTVAEHADLVVASLTPGPGGELQPSIERLRNRSDRLAAVAALDTSGRLQSLYPDEAGYRAAASAALDAPLGPVATGVQTEDRRRELWGIVVPLNRIDTAASRKVLLLFAYDSHTASWLTAALVVASVVGVGCLLGFGFIVRWFELRVARPLRSLAGCAGASGSLSRGVPPIETQGWRETERISELLRELSLGIAESDHLRQQTECSAESRLRDRERRFTRQLRRAEDQAALDPLTGLRNRSYLEKDLEELLANHRAGGEDLAVAMLDVDNFKFHNDTCGHAAGDEVLSFIGDLLRGSIRPADRAIRYGGDEFLLLLPGASAEQAVQVVERVVMLFGQYAAPIRSPKPLSLSGGITSLKCNPGCKDADALIKQADRALYAAKRDGKNDVAVWSAT